MIRVEVTDNFGMVAQILDADELLGKLSPHQRERLDALAAGLIGRVAALLGSDEDHARKVIIADLARQVADEQAYDRIAEQRGVLAL